MPLRFVVRGVLVFGCVLGGAGGSVRGDPPALPVPKAPAGSSASADAALAAFRAEDWKALEAVSKGRSDPWVVATVLLERGEAKAAAAFAAAAPSPETQALPAYVARHVVGPKDAALRGALQAALEAVTGGRVSEGIAIYDRVLRDVKELLLVQTLHQRALALDGEGRTLDAAEDFSRAGAEAEALGWIRRASAMLDGAGAAWLRLGENHKALAAFEKEVSLDERRQAQKELVTSLSHLATASGRTGDWKRALSLQERAIPLAESVGDRATLIVLLNNQATALRIAGRTREALPYCERAASVAREVGDAESVARSDQNRGITLRDLGDARGAAAALSMALAAFVAQSSATRAVETRLQLSPLQRLLGDRAAAKATAVQALADAERLADPLLLAQAQVCLAGALLTEGALSEGRVLLEGARAVQEQRGRAEDLTRTLKSLAILYLSLREMPKALEAGERAVALARAKCTGWDLAVALDGLSQVCSALGEWERAIELAEEAASWYEKVGNVYAAAGEWDRIGRAKVALGDAQGGLAILEKARVQFEAAGDPFRLAMAESTIGEVHEERGAWASAIASHERALALLQGLDAGVRAGHEMIALGRIWRSRGEIGRALGYQEAAESLLSKQPDGYEIAVLRTDMAWVWEYLGELERAIELRQRALKGFEAAGMPADAAVEGSAIATLHARRGQVSAALEEAARAAAFLEKVGDPAEQSLGWGRLGQVHALAGDLPMALEMARKSLALLEGLKDPLPLAFCHQRIGQALLRMERSAEALASATTAKGLFTRAGRPDLQGGAEADRALALNQLGRQLDALEASRASIKLLAGSLRGLGDEELAQGWSARQRLPFAVGLRAAATLDRPADAVWFLESARGRSLLEMFAVRDTLRDSILPPALREAELEARDRLHAAGESMRRAAKRADAAAYESAHAASDRASRDLAKVEARAQREAKRAADLANPEPATVAAIQKGLREGEALVLYGFTAVNGIAVVIQPSGARLVSLAPTEEVERACEGLRAADAGEDPTEAIQTLQRLVVTPLGLGTSVKRWIACPDHALAFVPFSLLDREREVVLVPSATVLGLLRADGANSRKGQGTLALGDPAYRPATDPGAVALLRGGSLFLPIPESGDEAREVGTTVLVRENATTEALRENLAKHRWRSVHLACHGILDAERPSLSGIALTPVGEDDGVLRVLDVFRLKVDADLVVLSACETARGKVVSGEGILGLTRAFLYAGAPRVIASLWKVDDAATRSLMTKFYARWNAGASPAVALREAQAFVASQPAWAHPHYWAAWTLWGLPD